MEDSILTLSETAKYLKVAEKTLQRMIKDGKIPCTRVGNQWRFIKSVLDEWLISGMSRGRSGNSQELLEQGEMDLQLSRLLLDLVTPLKTGSKKEILTQLTEPLIRKGLLSNPDEYLNMLLMRETMVSTAIGSGLAIPHIRRPQDQDTADPYVVMGISPEGLEYDAPDNSRVHLFFLIFCSSEVVHLRLISRISSLFKQNNDLSLWKGLENKEKAESLLLKEESRLLGLRK